MKKKPKTPKQIERHFKGVANYRRIEILLLIAKGGNVTLEGIAEDLNGNIKTISEHTRRLVQAGLINKQYRGRMVIHSLSPYGKQFFKFISTFLHS